MAQIDLQFENTKANRWQLLDDLFESTEQYPGMMKEIPGGGTITLRSIPAHKGAGQIASFIAIALAVPSALVNVAKIAEYLSRKCKTNNVTKIWVNHREIETTPEGITRAIETTITIEQTTEK